MYKILVADDEQIIRSSICRLLEPFAGQVGEVVTAEDGLDALFKMKESAPDLVIFDINMPFLNGLDAIRKIRQEKNDVLIIIISGYNRFEYAQEAIKNKVSSYLLKPIQEEEFHEAVSSALKSLENHESAPEPEPQAKDLSGQIIAYLEGHYADQELDVNSVCDYFYTSSSTLTRLLKKETGMSFSDYLTKVRMNHAIRLLTEGKDYNIKEISALVGFSSQHYFSRAFKNFTGLSPKQYKDSLLK